MKQQQTSKHIAVIGGGINGLTAANYLVRAGFMVTLLEKNAVVGGACASRKVKIGKTTYEYPSGASVFGFMQDFVFKETGLSRVLKVSMAKVPYALSFEDKNDPLESIWGDSAGILHQAREQWGERGDVKGFLRDNAIVRNFLLKGFLDGTVPTVEDAEHAIGKKLTKLWITGPARQLVDAYFTSEELKVLTLIPVNESGPVSIDAPYSAFNIPLMGSGSVFDGEWGYVRGGIWNVAQTLGKLNVKAGVKQITGAIVTNVSADGKTITYKHTGKLKTLRADMIVFATDPLHAAGLLKDHDLLRSISKKKLAGSSGKQVFFFKTPVQWKDGVPSDTMRFIFYKNGVKNFEKATHQILGKKDFEPGYLEVYPEDGAYRKMGLNRGYEMIAVYCKHFKLGKKGEELDAARKTIEKTMLRHIKNPQDFVKSLLFTPADLRERFGFSQGNIDHVEIENGQTYFARNYSPNPKKSFFQFGKHSNIFYCGAGSYPCGSIAGTPGYMCAQNILRAAA